MARPKKVVHFKVTKFANSSSGTFSLAGNRNNEGRHQDPPELRKSG